MSKTLIAIGLCISGAAFAQQNQPDSIHIVLHENQNGNLRTLDTIVPISQQQQLFTWMQANGWEAPPPPVPGQPMTFEHQIIIEGDSGSHSNGNQRMMFVTTEGDTMYPKHPEMIMIRMDGDSMMMPPIPPMPPGAPGECRKVVVVEGGDGAAHGEGDMVFMRHPMPPGGNVEVDVTEKDTIINGETRKMIIKTERIILPPTPPTPPTPPGAQGNNKSSVPAGAKGELQVYPNPANSIITVEFDIAAKDKTTLRVIDMNGKVVYNEEIVDDNSKHVYREINLSGKGKGTYTVEVAGAKKKIVEKVILQ